MKAYFWALTQSDICSLAFQLATRNNIKNPFSVIKAYVGRNRLRVEYEKYKFSPTRIWNVDETGCSFVQSKQPEILAAKGKRQIGCMASVARGSLITVISCMSAGRTSVLPFFIFPRKKHFSLLMEHAPPDSGSVCHISK